MDGKCCFASKKIKGALQKIQTSVHRINFSKENDDTFYDKCDLWVRQACSQLRSLKQQPCQMSRCLKKASVQEATTLEDMVEMVDIAETESGPQGGNLEVQTSKCKDLVLYEAKKPQKEDTSPLKIFSRILAKRNSDESDTGAATTAPSVNPTASSSTTKPSSLRRQNAQTFSPKPGLKRQNEHLRLSRQENSWLAAALAKPVEEDCPHICFH